MSELEIAWRAWQRLGGRDKTKFLRMFREAYREEREGMLAASRRAAGKPPLATPLDEVVVATLDFDCAALMRQSRCESATD